MEMERLMQVISYPRRFIILSPMLISNNDIFFETGNDHKCQEQKWGMTMISGRPMRLHCLVPVLFLLLLISGVNGGLPFRAVGADASGRTGNVDAGGVANHVGGDDDKIGGWPFRVAIKTPLESIQNITASVSNYEHGRRIEEHKNIPIYVAQATIASLVPIGTFYIRKVMGPNIGHRSNQCMCVDRMAS